MEILWGILGGGTGLIITTLIIMHGKRKEEIDRRFEMMDRKLKAAENEAIEIKSNYIDKFNDVKIQIGDVEKAVRESNHSLANKTMQGFAEIRLLMEEKFQKKDNCLANDKIVLDRLFLLEKDMYIVKNKDNQ